MSLWERITKEIQEGAYTISEKAGEFFRSGAELLKDGVEVASEKAAYASRLAKLKWERSVLHREIEKAFTALGGQAYELFVQEKLGELAEAAKDKFENLRDLEAKLESKEQEIENLPKTFSAEGGAKSGVADLKKDLEAGGGTIVQTVLKEQSTLVGQKLKNLALPQDVLIGTIVRGDKVIIPEGDTVLMVGDRITILGKKEAIDQVIALVGADEAKSSPDEATAAEESEA